MSGRHGMNTGDELRGPARRHPWIPLILDLGATGPSIPVLKTVDGLRRTIRSIGSGHPENLVRRNPLPVF